MKILFNGIIAKVGGAKVIINSFINNIEEDDGNEYHFLAYQNTIYKHVLDKKKKNVFIDESLKGDMNPIRKYLWYQFSLPKFIRSNKFDYLINISNYGPKNPGCKQILLLHNAKHISKEMKIHFSFTNKLKLLLWDAALRTTLKGVSTLVVQTEYMKKGILDKFKFDESRIEVIPSSTAEIDRNHFNHNLENKLKEFIAGESNVLSNISLYYKHKNFEILLEAIKVLKFKRDFKLKLILTVDKNQDKHADEFLRLIDKYDIKDCVLSVGNVDHNHIHQILGKTKVFIFPSYAESFGIPFVEAMQFELPIIAADLGFAHDVCDNAALYFQYDNANDLADQIIALLNDVKMQESLRSEGKRRYDLFDEKAIVKRYWKLLR